MRIPTTALCLGALIAMSAFAASSIHEFQMKTLKGDTVSLGDYQGKVLLVVNVASRCGYTPQYEGLQKLHEKYADKGVVVMGFPANNFGSQEPGSDAEIQTFCQRNYGVSFPMFSKISVKGGDKHPLYQFLTKGGDEVPWNFTKFLVGKDGKVVRRFEPGVEPLSSELTAAIDKAL
jgi:glutathione peroxidase